jgi:hypothetical protein
VTSFLPLVQYMSLDSADLSPSSSPPLHSTTQMHDPDSLNQVNMHFDRF